MSTENQFPFKNRKVAIKKLPSGFGLRREFFYACVIHTFAIISFAQAAAFLKSVSSGCFSAS